MEPRSIPEFLSLSPLPSISLVSLLYTGIEEEKNDKYGLMIQIWVKNNEREEEIG